MYTVDLLNQELEKYCVYMNCHLPNVTNIQHCDISGAIAKFVPDKPSLNEYTIQISPSLYEKDLYRQQAIIWHEFTHLYDWHFYNAEKQDITKILYTYSEAHATEIEYRKLLSLNTKQTIGAEDRFLKITTKRTYKEEMAQMLFDVQESIQDFQNSKSSDTLTDVIRVLSYYCGGCLLFNNKIRTAYVLSLQKLIPIYGKCLTNYADAIFSRNCNIILQARQTIIDTLMFNKNLL